MAFARWFTSHRTLSPPAIWGKLPGHGDFVRHGVRHAEDEAWEAWLEREGMLNLPAGKEPARIPIAFVLPPAALPFAPRRFVFGVILPSHDRVGRPFPLLVYQKAHARWAHAYLLAQGCDDRLQQDWLFLLACHATDAASARLEGLVAAIGAQWRRHEPGHLAAWLPQRLRAHATQMSTPQLIPTHPLHPTSNAAPAAALHGVRHFPWSDWPRRAMHPKPRQTFWQQDTKGGFIGAADRLRPLWNDNHP